MIAVEELSPSPVSQMFRLVLALACVAYLLLYTLLVRTSHSVEGERHLFYYNSFTVLFALGFNIIPITGAWFLWRVKNSRFVACMLLLAIPLFAFMVMPQLFMERVEVTPTHLIHRREPPHGRYNADIAFADIASVVELEHGVGTGFLLILKDGSTVELPANTVLTAARETVLAEFRRRNIPVKIVKQ